MPPTSRPNLYARKLEFGMGLGVFTPSMPANVVFPEKYQHGLRVAESLGFKVIEGEITRARVSQGYRTASPQERASEFMSLIRNPEVHALISTIGGTNSSSLIPYLDFDEIRASRKIICGYSDVTSLHLALLKFAGLRSFYGPAIMPSFGEWPSMLDYTRTSFLNATMNAGVGSRSLQPPPFWSNHFRDAKTDAWKVEPRTMVANAGWKALRPGVVEGRLISTNLSTLCSNAGTPHFPDLDGKILLIETMSGTAATEERLLRQLERVGVFQAIRGLIVGKPEVTAHPASPSLKTNFFSKSSAPTPATPSSPNSISATQTQCSPSPRTASFASSRAAVMMFRWRCLSLWWSSGLWVWGAAVAQRIAARNLSTREPMVARTSFNSAHFPPLAYSHSS